MTQELVVRSYRDLEVWQTAMDLVVECYRLTEIFPADEKAALAAGLRRAALTIPANIAEGHGRTNRTAFFHHLSIALGAEAELQTHFDLALRLRLVRDHDVAELQRTARGVARQLRGLMRSLEAR